MANAAPEVFATEAAQVLVEDGHGGAGTHSEPELWGLAPFQIVSLSMLGGDFNPVAGLGANGQRGKSLSVVYKRVFSGKGLSD